MSHRRRAPRFAARVIFLLTVSPLACISASPDDAHDSAKPAADVTGDAASAKKSLRLFPPKESGRARESYIARGDKAMIAAAHPLAAGAGFEILKAGGNAVDAAVAASFALAVVRPQSTGIGGGGFWIGFDRATKSTEVLDFRERAPKQARRDMYLDAKGEPAAFNYKGQSVPDASVNGHLAVGIPGMVKGLLQVHKAHGKLPLKDVVAPAIELAEKGFTVYPGLAEAIVERAEIMRQFPATRAIFLPQGKPLKAGDLLVQKDLAWTLKEISRYGAEAFYRGEVAKKLVAEIKDGKGILTAQDLAKYQVQTREPILGAYRGYKIASMPPPSSGGTHIAQMLNILSGDNYSQWAHGSTTSVHLLAEVMRRAFADRAVFLGDPAFFAVPLKGLLSLDYARTLRASIDLKKATPSQVVKPGNPSAFEHPETSHLSVIDAWGNAVSTTQTVNYTFGACVVAKGTGIVLNDEMDDFSKKAGVPNAFGLVGDKANEIAPGKTPLSSMSPTLVFDPSGELTLVAGSPGGPRIITATLQTIINVVDHKMSLADAVHASRIHHQWLPDELRYEQDGLAPEVVQALTAMGHKLAQKSAIGDVQAVMRERGALVGVSDTRSEGRPMGF